MPVYSLRHNYSSPGFICSLRLCEFCLSKQTRDNNGTPCPSTGKSAKKLSIAKLVFGRPPTCQYVPVRVLLRLVVTAFATAVRYGVASLG